jgi:acyl dehydratase
MQVRTINGIEELRGLVGEEVGVSGWELIDQPAIDRFAEATGDHYFIHVDPDRAKSEAGLDSTIAHGLLTLSLGPKLSYEIFNVEGVGSALNYGYDKVRFLAPLPVGSRVRMRLAVASVEESEQGVRIGWRQSFEVEGASKPVCVADAIVFYWKQEER